MHLWVQGCSCSVVDVVRQQGPCGAVPQIEAAKVGKAAHDAQEMVAARVVQKAQACEVRESC